MYTLVFLICTSVDCSTASVGQIFFDKVECETKAQEIIDLNYALIESGRMPPHTADFQCVGWSKA